MRAIVVDQGGRVARALFPYGTAVFWVGLAVWLTVYFGQKVVGFAPLLLASVMYSAWSWGRGPGLTAAVAATLGTMYMLEPINSFEFSPENGPRIVIFLMVALLCVLFQAPARLAAALGKVAPTPVAAAQATKPQQQPLTRIETTDVYDLIDEALRERVEEIDQKGLQLSVHLEAERRMIEGDSQRLRQLFGLLLDNAIHATQTGGTIVISATNSNLGDLEIEVADTGEGIETELLPYVFEMGGRDLTQCWGIVEAHRGKIAVYSPGRGQGAAFVVRLPAVG